MMLIFSETQHQPTSLNGPDMRKGLELLSTYNIHLSTIYLQANLGVTFESSGDQYNFKVECFNHCG